MNKMMKRVKLDISDRVVIPKPICKQLNIGEGSWLNISLEKNTIIIKPEKAMCKMCGEEIESNKEISLCDMCIKTVQKHKFVK